ncbi:Smr/MutS family protein [Crocinitomicaceae bacterium]|nr:Smr/MutS family protein [Crocinitomicaceae bacterium]
MSFTVGQKITFLHEQGEGKVIEILGVGKFKVEDDHGFERICLKSEIAPVYSNDYKINDTTIAGINEDETFSTSRKAQQTKHVGAGKQGFDVWEIDLHIESLTNSHSGWTNTDIVRKQLMELRSFVKRARAKRIRKLIVIHGVGTGVLKEEVREFFRDQEGVEAYDASYQEYGKGATAVEIRYNL